MSPASTAYAPGAVPEIRAIVIGASVGGVDAVGVLLAALPKPFAPAVIVVLHIPANRPSLLASLFAARCRLPVHEALDKEHVEGGTVYVAPPGYHLQVETDRSFSLSCEERVNYARPSIDVLFETAADAYGRSLAGVLLTGANYDGAAGLAGMKVAGALTIVQDPASAEIPTMPEAAIRRAAPDLILPLDEIRSLLARLGENR